MNEFLSIKKLNISYGDYLAVSDVDLSLKESEILCITGESGCGKSTLLKALLGIDDSLRISGNIYFNGNDILCLKHKERRQLCGKGITMVFQNPYDSFNPIKRYKIQLKEMLKSQGLYDKNDFKSRVEYVFTRLSLNDYERILESCPYQMSGGMNQRIAIAFAMLLSPKLLLADEPSSAIDSVTQKILAQELMIMRDIFKCTQIIVTHSLGMANMIADKVAVMYGGRVVEIAVREEIFTYPHHPYTKGLIDCVLTKEGKITELEGALVNNPAKISGCNFANRCKYCDNSCDKIGYSLREVADNHFSSCTRDNK